LYVRTILSSPSDEVARLYGNAARTFTRWLTRNSGESRVYQTLGEVTTAHNLSGRNTFARSNVRRNLLTPEFVETAIQVVGSGATAVVELREFGVTVNWIRDLHAALDARTLRRVRRNSAAVISGLRTARNVEPGIVARFLKAGVYAHIHTYARAHARPEQVLAVYRATNGERTLAALLAEGMTVPEAVSSVSR
jgi:hypothetical protein